jgi:hypothetical protein
MTAINRARKRKYVNIRRRQNAAFIILVINRAS